MCRIVIVRWQFSTDFIMFTMRQLRAIIMVINEDQLQMLLYFKSLIMILHAQPITKQFILYKSGREESQTNLYGKY